MYATEKYVQREVRDLKNSINDVASDLGYDIKSLHELIISLKERIEFLEQVKSNDT